MGLEVDGDLAVNLRAGRRACADARCLVALNAMERSRARRFSRRALRRELALGQHLYAIQHVEAFAVVVFTWRNVS